MMDYTFEDIYGGVFLKCADLKGQDRTAVIENIEFATFKNDDGNERRQAVLCFRNTNKKFGCNKTNATIIYGMYGPMTEWIGKAITLYPTRTPFKGEMTDCVRIREEPPQRQLPSTNAVQAVGGGNGQMKQVAAVASESLRRVIQKQHDTHVSSTTHEVAQDLPDEDIPF